MLKLKFRRFSGAEASESKYTPFLRRKRRDFIGIIVSSAMLTAGAVAAFAYSQNDTATKDCFISAAYVIAGAFLLSALT